MGAPEAGAAPGGVHVLWSHPATTNVYLDCGTTLYDSATSYNWCTDDFSDGLISYTNNGSELQDLFIQYSVDDDDDYYFVTW